MTTSDMPVARRELLAGAGAGLTLGLSGALTVAQAQTAAPAAPSGDIWSQQYWANKGDVKLALYRKRIGAPTPGSAAKPVLFLVHGSSNAARSSYDITLPGKAEYSLMNVFARYGYDVWTMDHEGYGQSSRTAGNSDIASGVEDLKAGTEIVAKETGAPRMHFFGTSSGAIRAAAFAVARPEKIDRLILSAFTYKGTGSPTLTDRAKRVEEYRASNTRLRDRAMIRSIFTRDALAASYDPAVGEAIADEELKYGDRVPTGTYLDMTANLPLVDPKKLTCPVLLTRGDHDGIATEADLLDFYQQLPNGDRQFIIMPNTAHSPTFSNNRHMFWHIIQAFLTMPAPAAA